MGERKLGFFKRLGRKISPSTMSQKMSEALNQGDLDTVKALLAQGEEVNARDQLG